MIWHVASDMRRESHFSGSSLAVAKALLKYMDKAILEYGVRHASEIVVQTHDQHQATPRALRSPGERMLVRNLHPLPNEILDKFCHPDGPLDCEP
jgi:hypothetical protein